MSGLLRRLADGLLKPAKGGVHPLARLRWLASLALMPAEATRRSEVLPAHEADRPGPSQPSSAQAGAARSSAAPPLSPEPLSPEPPELSAHGGEAPSPLVRAEAAPAKAEYPAGLKKAVRVTAASVARAPASRSEPDSVRTAVQRETCESTARIVLAADSPCAASAGESGPEPHRASPPGESAEAGDCSVLESSRAPEGETPPTPSSRLAARSPAGRPNAARAERDAQEIHIHIGRIEVSALPSPPARKSPRPAAMSLDEYLSRRSGEKR